MGWGHAARAALGGGLDRLPGRAALAQPGAARRAPDRGADPAARARVGRRPGRRAGGRAARAGRAAAGPQPRLPAPAVRRAEAARDDRDGAGLPAVADHRGRAHHGARRDGPGADPRPALRPGARARRRHDDHQPRPVGAGRRVRPRRGDVRRTRGRDRHARSRSSPTRSTPTRGRSPAAFPRIGDRGRPLRTRPGWPATRPTRATCRRGARSRRGARAPPTSASTAEPPLLELEGDRAAACVRVGEP